MDHATIRASRHFYQMCNEGYIEVDPKPLGAVVPPPPAVEAPIVAAPIETVERCHYHVPRDIKDAERIPVKEFARWQAPADEQLRGVTPGMIREAQWLLREVPVCNISGDLVEIAVTIEKEWIAARLLCRQCNGLPPTNCEGQGKCHGALKWCDRCGDVSDVCDADVCDCHPKPIKENHV